MPQIIEDILEMDSLHNYSVQRTYRHENADYYIRFMVTEGMSLSRRNNPPQPD